MSRDLWQVYVDAAVRSDRGRCGLAAIVRNGQGAVVQWFGATTGKMTNHEAEYAAAILALRQLRHDRVQPIVLYSDSLLLVHQMQGRAAIRA
ncbi:MAG: reverse transcriptase-like protein, partial [Acidobacteria bacterium]|nr:reverse transcriptase-like protein [Acidobacteriota bacterium]